MIGVIRFKETIGRYLKKVNRNIIPVLAIIWCLAVIVDQLLGDVLGIGSIFEGWANMTILTSSLFIILFGIRLISKSDIRIKIYILLLIISSINLTLAIFFDDRQFLSSRGTSLLFLLLCVHGVFFEQKKRQITRITLKFIVYAISNVVLILYFIDPLKVYTLPGFESMSWNTAIGFLLYSSTMLSGYYDTLIKTEDIPEDFSLVNRKFVEFWFIVSFSFPVFIILGISLLHFINGMSTQAAMALALFCVCLFPFPMTYLIYRETFDWSLLMHHKNQKLYERNEDIRYHNELLQEFAQITSHNLRGPAVGLGNIAEIAFDETTPAELRQQSKKLLKEKLPTLVDTVDSLAEFYNMIREGEIKYERCSFEDELTQAVSICKSTDPDKNFQYELKKDLQIKEVDYPEIYLENIFYNLVSNSFKYRSEARKLVIEVSTRDLGTKGVLLRFKDNGIGMDLSYFRNKIFKFGRSYHNFEDSRGIGLFIVKNQLIRLGDTIEVNSKEGSYTEFIIKLNHHGQKELGYN